MNLINVKKDIYLNAIGSAWQRGTKEERERLRYAKHGLFPEKLFKGAPHGHAVSLCTWLMVLRADMRGKLALTKFLEPGYEQRTTPTGQAYKARIWKPSKEALQKALEQQHALITNMMKECPGFFAGMLVDADTPQEATAPTPEVPAVQAPAEKASLSSAYKIFKALVGA